MNSNFYFLWNHTDDESHTHKPGQDPFYVFNAKITTAQAKKKSQQNATYHKNHIPQSIFKRTFTTVLLFTAL